MITPGERRRPIRLFLDSGVIIEGCFAPWGAAKAVLILAMMRERFTVVLAEAIEREIQRAVARKVAALDPASAESIAGSVAGWLDRVKIERCLLPSEDEIRERLPMLLPALRQVNDLPAIVTAIQARPDWVMSSNVEHWNEALATRAGLHIVTPLGFLRQLRLSED